MNALDSPLEVLSFSSVHLSPLFAAAFSNLWALFAVVAAAAMFHLHRPKTPKAASPTSDKAAVVVAPTTTTTTTSSTKLDTLEIGKCVVSKEVFTVHYHVDDHVKNDDAYVYDGDFYEEDDDGEREESKTSTMIEESWKDDETWRAETTRGGEFGWYDYQDIRVIDGSVVRLWGHGERRSTSSPRGCCSRRNSPTCCSLGVTPFSFELAETR